MYVYVALLVQLIVVSACIWSFSYTPRYLILWSRNRSRKACPQKVFKVFAYFLSCDDIWHWIRKGYSTRIVFQVYPNRITVKTLNNNFRIHIYYNLHSRKSSQSLLSRLPILYIYIHTLLIQSFVYKWLLWLYI